MTHDSDSTTNSSRRGFLRHTGLAAGAAIGSLALAPAQAKVSDSLPAKWDETVDVLVIGTGFAGLAAALEARAAKADVMVIDKMAVFGGNSIINGGDMAVAGTKMQKELGIEDSPELMLKDMMKAGGYINHPPLAKMVAEHGAEVLKGHRFPDDKSGKTAFIKARRGVVIAAGGFAQGWRCGKCTTRDPTLALLRPITPASPARHLPPRAWPARWTCRWTGSSSVRGPAPTRRALASFRSSSSAWWVMA